MTLQIPAYGYITLLALLFAGLHRLQGVGSRVVIALLVLVCLVEFVVAPSIAVVYGNNQALYSIYTPILTSLYIYLLSYRHDQYRWWLVALPLVALPIDLFVNPDVDGLRIYPYLTGLLVSVMLFVRRVRYTIVQESIIALWRQQQFYLGLGVALFFLMMFPLLWCIDLFITESSSGLYGDLLQTANFLLALGYLGAALCPTLTPKSTES